MRTALALAWGLALATPALAAPAAPLWGYLGLAQAPVVAGDMRPFAAMHLALPQAIAAAAQASGGRVLAVSFGHTAREGWYDATVLAGGQIRTLRVDAAGKAVASGRGPVPQTALDRRAQRDLAALLTAPVDLARAVRLAEQADGGRAVAAGMEQLQGVPQYYVQLVGGGKLHAIIVDPHTGRAAPPA